MPYAVAFVEEKGQPVGRPMWVAKGAEKSRNFGSYSGPFWMVADQPQHAKVWAREATAAEWAKMLTGDGQTYRFEAVPAPEVDR